MGYFLIASMQRTGQVACTELYLWQLVSRYISAPAGCWRARLGWFGWFGWLGWFCARDVLWCAVMCCAVLEAAAAACLGDRSQQSSHAAIGAGAWQHPHSVNYHGTYGTLRN